MNVPRQNLSLLVILDALLKEKSVTRAAARLNLSQPAMSSAVARLREWLGDPLLVKVKGGFALTARAEGLAEPVRKVLSDIMQIVSTPEPFNPQSAVCSFRIATNDAFQLAVLPSLMSQLQSIAPGISLTLIPCGPVVPVELLESGEIDLCCGYFAEIPRAMHTNILLEERLVSVVRKQHPKIKRTLTLKLYAEATQVLVAPQGDPFLAVAEQTLRDVGLKMNVGLQVPHILSVALIIAKTDMLATLPERTARRYAEMLDLRVFEPPIAFPSLNISAVWHERNNRSPAQIWLREQLSDVCQQL